MTPWLFKFIQMVALMDVYKHQIRVITYTKAETTEEKTAKFNAIKECGEKFSEELRRISTDLTPPENITNIMPNSGQH